MTKQSLEALKKELQRELDRLESQLTEFAATFDGQTETSATAGLEAGEIKELVRETLEQALPGERESVLAALEPRVAEFVRNAVEQVRAEIVAEAGQSSRHQAHELEESVHQLERAVREQRTLAGEAIKHVRSTTEQIAQWEARLAEVRKDLREEAQLAHGQAKQVHDAHEATAQRLVELEREKEALRDQVTGLERRLEKLEATSPSAATQAAHPGGVAARDREPGSENLAYGQQVSRGDTTAPQSFTNGSHVPRPTTSTVLPSNSDSEGERARDFGRDPQLLSSSAKQLLRMIERYRHDFHELDEDELWQQVHHFYPHPEGGKDRARFQLDLNELRRAGLLPEIMK